MGKRMNWNRAKRREPLRDPPKSRALEARADTILTRAQPAARPPRIRIETDELPESICYRSVGTVLQKDGRWFALDGQGQVAGEFDERWKAWRHADKFGMVPC